MPIARIQPGDLNATRDVFVSAIRFATSIDGSCPPFGHELKTSAQEQVEFMLVEDEDIMLVFADDEVKSAARTGLSKVFSSFENELSSLLTESNFTVEMESAKVMESVTDLEWMCNILPKMELMKDFVSKWIEISADILRIIDDEKLDSFMWDLKVKLIEVTSKVLEAVGYGNVVIPAARRVQLLKMWLPYIRKMKPLLDSKCDKETSFNHKMDEGLCQSIEGTIVSLIVALPSNDQADILADWMAADQVKYPDLSEAFEIWCYRSKSANRRLENRSDRVDDATA